MLKLRFQDGANNGIDDFDGSKLGNPDENLASENNDILLGLERRDTFQTDEIIPMFINQYQDTQYQFRVNLSNWDDGIDIYVEDNYLDTETLITVDQAYNFSIDSTIPESEASDRFNLKLDNTTLGVNGNDVNIDFSLYPNPTEDGRFQIETYQIQLDNAHISIYDVLGNEVLEKNIENVKNNIFSIDAGYLASGVYIVKFKQSKQEFSTKLIIK